MTTSDRWRWVIAASAALALGVLAALAVQMREQQSIVAGIARRQQVNVQLVIGRQEEILRNQRLLLTRCGTAEEPTN